MTVYAVFLHYAYEGGELCSLNQSEKGALKAVRKIMKRYDPGYYTQIKTWEWEKATGTGDGISIVEQEVLP